MKKKILDKLDKYFFLLFDIISIGIILIIGIIMGLLSSLIDLVKYVVRKINERKK